MYFRFEPYFRPMIWGSETWIVSAYPNMESRVKGGLFAGKTLSELVEALGPALMGHAIMNKYGNSFPLLIKIIDAKDKLSIQVHPTDKQANRQGKGPVGKTEMWYGLKSSPEAYLYSGLRNQLTPQIYAEHVANHSIVNDLAKYEPKEGDCFFLPAGRIHAIGAGCQLLEIQQTSDVTYRIYDYDRRDAEGKPRELHTELAAECIDYNVLSDYQTHYEKRVNKEVTLVECPYFVTKALKVENRECLIDWSEEDRFLVLMVTQGEGALTIDGEAVEVKENDTILLPATTQKIVATGAMTLVTTTSL